jgi:hypothetical protein
MLHKVRVVVGDRVRVQTSRYDPTRGRSRVSPSERTRTANERWNASAGNGAMWR